MPGALPRVKGKGSYMKKNTSSKLAFVVVLAAVVAALTTVAVLVLRARRKHSLKRYNDPIDYDLDDCYSCDCCGAADEADEIPQEEPAAE